MDHMSMSMIVMRTKDMSDDTMEETSSMLRDKPMESMKTRVSQITVVIGHGPIRRRIIVEYQPATSLTW